MNGDKAYLLGLVIGGGVWGNAEDIFRVRLPYKQWGSYEQNPQRAGLISKDILKVVGPMFKSIYDLNISYDTAKSGEWNILCEGDLSELINDLEHFGIKCEGELRKNVTIDKIIPELVDDNLKRRFIAGLADTIASTKQSHRRFNDDKQALSFEITGYRFDFVCSLCKLLHSISCYPDQILWNHPNFHCASNPYDMHWKKGFKLRVLADQYHEFGAFAFTSKAQASQQNRELEKSKNTAIPCEEKSVSATPSCVHPAEHSEMLPTNIRDGHYLHNRHVCAVMNCEHAPCSEILELIQNAKNLINPFPILAKGTKKEIKDIVEQTPLYLERDYKEEVLNISKLYHIYKQNRHTLLWSANTISGYPINQIMQAVTYLIAASTNKLKGSRPKGKMDNIISDFLIEFPSDVVNISVPELLTPIILTKGDYAALVGPINPNVYEKLISIAPDNPYKIIVRQISEGDLKK